MSTKQVELLPKKSFNYGFLKVRSPSEKKTEKSLINK